MGKSGSVVKTLQGAYGLRHPNGICPEFQMNDKVEIAIPRVKN